MKIAKALHLAAATCVLILFASGCRTTNGPHFATKFRTTDGRMAEIGPRTETDGGWTFREPHMNKCWIASGFDFNGYDTLLIAPTLATVIPKDNEEGAMLAQAKQNVVIELSRLFRTRELFTNVVTSEADVPPGAHVLKMENTIVGLEKGSWGGRFWAGTFGAGQPVIVVAGKMTDGDKTVFTYEARRSGVSVGAHLALMEAEDIQLEDIRSLTLDVTDFAAAIAGKYKPVN